MTNQDFIKILKDINKKIIKDKNPVETITWINQKIKEVENEADYASDYIETLTKKLK